VNFFPSVCFFSLFFFFFRLSVNFVYRFKAEISKYFLLEVCSTGGVSPSRIRNAQQPWIESIFTRQAVGSNKQRLIYPKKQHYSVVFVLGEGTLILLWVFFPFFAFFFFLPYFDRSMESRWLYHVGLNQRTLAPGFSFDVVFFVFDARTIEKWARCRRCVCQKNAPSCSFDIRKRAR
jgi:hypothetical protein